MRFFHVGQFFRGAIALILSLVLAGPVLLGQPGVVRAEALGAIAEVHPPTPYRIRRRPSPDAIGKVYLGREIAQVMGHRAAMWLERPSRLMEERPDLLLQLLNLPGDAVVADIGAGTGLFSVRLAKQLPEGKVLAVDIQPEMLDILQFFKDEENLDNIELIQATDTDPHLPDNSVDLALVVDAYHEFEFPREVMTGVVRSLKPKGQVVLAEYRGENPLIAIKPHHKMTQRQVRKEMKAVGLVWQKTNQSLPQQHLMFFVRSQTP
ncbi:MAG: class I SAM-dependent methyltransferase [Synechococcales cyanobacterium CRU_2_2]|nr:class I SAM-dependent methyltransferase [Synechococcales cyanobacterium CRU_2_2]